MSPADTTNFLKQALLRSKTASSDFDLNPDITLPGQRKLRDAAVLIPVICDGAASRIILTKRASGMKHHPGQIAFPGGKVDAGDVDAIAAALREAREEIALPEAQVEVLGTLPQHETVTGFAVTPVLGRVRGGFAVRAEPGEVAEVFTVPLAHVLDRGNYRIESRIWQGRRRYYYTAPWGPYYIWGATARMLRNLAEGAAQ